MPKKSTTVSDIMTKPAWTVSADQTVIEAAKLMREADVGALIVVNADKSIFGILTDRDIVIRAVAAEDPTVRSAGQVCSAEVVTVRPDEAVSQVQRLMRDQGVRRVAVVADGAPVGMVSVDDLAADRAALQVAEILTKARRTADKARQTAGKARQSAGKATQAGRAKVAARRQGASVRSDAGPDQSNPATQIADDTRS